MAGKPLLSLRAVAAQKGCHLRSVQRAIDAEKLKARRVVGAPGARDGWAVEQKDADKWNPEKGR